MKEPLLLLQFSIFNGLEPDQLEMLAPLMEERAHKAGEAILAEGDKADGIYFILEGRVSVRKGLSLFAELGRGESFGEMEVLEVLPAQASVKAISPVNLVHLSMDALGEIYENDLRTYSFIFMNLARDLSRRLRALNEKAVSSIPVVEWG